MTRRLTTILLFLLLGAVVNVGVAWSIVLTSADPVDRRGFSIGDETFEIVDATQSGWLERSGWKAEEYVFVKRTARVGRICEQFEEVGQWYLDPGTRPGSIFGGGVSTLVAMREEVGLPFRSLAGSRVLDRKISSLADLGRDQYPYRSVSAVTVTIDKSYFPPEIRHLPLRPLPLGFVANTLLYAALLWLPFGALRRLRIRRGLCPACAYPVGESPVCTECGGAVRPASPS